MAELPVSFLDLDSLQVIGGATLAVSVIANTAQALLKRSSPWFAFGASLLVIAITSLAADRVRGVSDALLALANVCLLFCTASGIQGLVVHATTPRGGGGGDGGARGDGAGLPLIRSWFRSGGPLGPSGHDTHGGRGPRKGE